MKTSPKARFAVHEYRTSKGSVFVIEWIHPWWIRWWPFKWVCNDELDLFHRASRYATLEEALKDCRLRGDEKLEVEVSKIQVDQCGVPVSHTP